MPARTLADDFFARAELQPDHPVILGPKPNERVTYGELAGEVRALAGVLEGLGVGPGVNVGLHYPSGRAYIAYTYAVWACGGCVTPIPTELAPPEKRTIPLHIALDGVITVPRGREAFVDAASSAPEPVGLPQGALWQGGTRRREPPEGLSDVHAAFIRFTSGTTGSAKGVVLSHATIRERVSAANEVLAIGPDDRVVWMLSMAYHFAVTIVAYLSFGATIVLPANAFGRSILQAANDHDATILYGAPTHFELMTHDASGLNLPPLRFAIVTTTKLRPEIGARFRERFGRGANETFGIIEVGLPAINAEASAESAGSVGRVLPAYDLKLVSGLETAAYSADGSRTGEVLVRGPGILDAYYDPWRPRSEILAERGGYLATGDIGRLDAQGRLTLVGRSKDLISVSGMKFFPQEVEAVLEAYPGVAAARVYAVPDPRQGELPQADLVLEAHAPAPDDADLLQHCRERLAAYKIPRRFDVVAGLPKTASGKVLRRQVAAPAQALAPIEA